jgi:DNA-binding MarR family transcriptional regulator
MDSDAMTRFRSAVSRLVRDLNATSTDENLSPTQASVLGLIATRGPIGIAELTEREGLNPTMMSRVVGKLDDLHLIERSRDPVDMRTASVSVTPAGRKVNRRIKNARADIIASCMNRLPEESLAALLAALPALEELAAEVRLAGSSKPGRRVG